jgi:DNA-binding PadR family transcriptional regulator
MDDRQRAYDRKYRQTEKGRRRNREAKAHWRNTLQGVQTRALYAARKKVENHA